MTQDKALEAAARAMEHHNTDYNFDDFRVGLSAYLAQREAEGFVMAPVEPCDNMRGAGADELFGSVDDDWGEDAAKVYRAMIAARPRANVC